MPKTEPLLKVKEPDVLAQELKDDGIFPNSKLKLLVYRQAVELPEKDPGSIFERVSNRTNGMEVGATGFIHTTITTALPMKCWGFTSVGQKCSWVARKAWLWRFRQGT